MSDRPEPEAERLEQLLRLARSEPPSAPPALSDDIMRSARWQYTLRGTLRALSDLSHVMGVGLRWMMGERSRSGRREES